MRRRDRELPKEFGLELIDRCEYGTAAMIDENGQPYAVTLNLVREENKLYFHCAIEGKKIGSLRKNPNMCISFVGNVSPVPDKFTTLYESAIVRGKAVEMTEDEEKIHALRILCEKLTPANMSNFDEAIERSLRRTAVWRIDIEEITAKAKR